ncbi:RlpA-like double-psi beta-barrel-protein domain-containing protein-containing protein [Dichotomocladium elegans]|nr:RlpA-like double-psi beta-barrel-protein domain-containing protein-containing protein [Dichotomocladium elegans]
MRGAAIVILSLLFILGSVLLADATPASPYKKRTSDASRRRHNDLNKRGATYSGKATWFVPSTQGGSIGACGSYEADDDMIVAMNAKQYGNMSGKSSWCGKKLKISHKGKTVTATVNDACPECAYGSLDLTGPVFEKLGDLNEGVLAITWQEA